tara:strand:- start:1872 stop:2321 length:450 start_codon:yes stop_codon:yes gene_type:complete
MDEQPTPRPYIEYTGAPTTDLPDINIPTGTKDISEHMNKESLDTEEEEDTEFNDFFKGVMEASEKVTANSGGVDTGIPMPNFGNVLDTNDEVVSRLLIGAAILAALKRNTLFSVAGPTAILLSVFYPVIYLAMVFTDMFLFGNVKFTQE